VCRRIIHVPEIWITNAIPNRRSREVTKDMVGEDFFLKREIEREVGWNGERECALL
jgi:hypothetical protein